MSKEKKQRDILFEACKSIATNNRTPEWIKRYIMSEVAKAKCVEDEDVIQSMTLDEPTKHEWKVNDLAKTTNIDKTTYTIKLESESTIIDGVKLWNCEIVDGKGPREKGYKIPNVPETWLKEV